MASDAPAVGSRVRDNNGDWHASVAFDGSVHTLACEQTLDPPEQVSEARLNDPDLEGLSVCEECRDALESSNDEGDVPELTPPEDQSPLRQLQVANGATLDDYVDIFEIHPAFKIAVCRECDAERWVHVSCKPGVERPETLCEAHAPDIDHLLDNCVEVRV